ncbi:MAG: ribbon-helix-helix domain-containing protein [Rhodospirillaceae bacterium]
MTATRKRSVTLDRHRTSLSLEDPFWEALKDIAREQGKSLHALVEEIDRTRAEPEGNLSAALRVFVLRDLQEKLRR